MTSLSRKIFLAAVAACALIAVATSPHAQEKKAEPKKAAKKAGLSAEETKYLRELGRRNLGEVQYSKMAASKALTPEVKEFAQKMVAAHTKALNEQRAFAKSKGIDLQESLSKKQQEGMKKVQAVPGTRFDRAYLEQMMKDHQVAIQVTQQAAAKAKDPQFKALLDKSVPEMQRHWDEAQRLLNSRPW